MSHRYYLIARYGRRAELQGYRAILEQHGHVVTSRWLTDPEPCFDNGTNALPHDQARGLAMNNIADLQAADRILAFTQAPDSSYGRGGRHWEASFAMWILWTSLPDRIYVHLIGPEENIFCALVPHR